MSKKKGTQKDHQRIKDNVRRSFDFQLDNSKRFNRFRKFAFKTTITEKNQAFCDQFNRPAIEANIVEAYISRLLGEFSLNEPNLIVTSKTQEEGYAAKSEFLEGLFRDIFYEAETEDAQYNVFKDLLSGGFSCWKVYSDYDHSMSMNQRLYLTKVFDPTMVFYDPCALDPHKASGQYFGECIPMNRKEFEDTYGVSAKGMKFRKDDIVSFDGNDSFSSFNWSFKSGCEEILLLCEYYEKKKRRRKIVELSNGEIMFLSEYKRYAADWDMLNVPEQIPAVVRERTTVVEKICKYLVVEDQIISYEETDLPSFPYVFVPGSAEWIKGNGDTVEYMTRPYIYNTHDVQVMKNTGLQTALYEIATTTTHKMIAPLEGIPDGYQDAYKNVQSAKGAMIYNQFKKDEPNVRLDPPQMIVRPPMPPEFLAVSEMADRMMQAVLGNYDISMAEMGKTEMSGKAILAATSLSNSAARPFFKSYLNSLQVVANKIMEYIPITFRKNQDVGILDSKNNRNYFTIDPMAVKAQDFDVRVEPGANFAIQQEATRTYIKELMSASPSFAQFIDQKALDILVANIGDVKDADELRERTDQWMQEQEQMRQQQAQMAAQMPNPQEMAMELANKQMTIDALIRQQKIVIEEEKNRTDTALDATKLSIDKEKVRNDRMKLLAEIELKRQELAADMTETQNKEFMKLMDMAMRAAESEQKAIDENVRDVVEVSQELVSENVEGT